MALNLIKVYNALLELLYRTERENIASIRGVFNQDIANNPTFTFRGIQIYPTTAEGEDSMDRLFRHLTTTITDEATRKREFETARAVRLHWIRHHVEERETEGVLVFTIDHEKRTYILDQRERYVVILEPLRNGNGFYLLTAYPLEPNSYRNIMKRYERNGREGL